MNMPLPPQVLDFGFEGITTSSAEGDRPMLLLQLTHETIRDGQRKMAASSFALSPQMLLSLLQRGQEALFMVPGWQPPPNPNESL